MIDYKKNYEERVKKYVVLYAGKKNESNDFDINLEGNQHIHLYKRCHLFIIDPINQNKAIFDSLINEYFIRRIRTFNEIFFPIFIITITFI